MASKKKNTKSNTKKGGTILRCTNIAFEKKPKKDFKNQMLTITYETASGTWTQKKIFADLWKFIETTSKSHKKVVGKFVTNASKYKNEYMSGSQKNAFKMIKDVINNIGKNKKILGSDSKITSFIGAKRDYLNDIKTSQIIKNSKNSKTSKTNKSSKDSTKKQTFVSDLNGETTSKKHKQQEKIDDNNNNNNSKEEEKKEYKQQIIDLKQEIDTIKRKHLSEISSLKQENHNLKLNNSTLKETNEASVEARQELEEKVLKYESELGRDQIDDAMALIFSDEFKKQEDPAEKYYQRTKEQQKRIEILEKQIVDLTHENGELRTQLERAKYIADHLATEVTELANPDYEQLEEDYKEVESELDEITAIKEQYEMQMANTAKILDELELEAAKMRPHFEEYPQLCKKLDLQQKNNLEISTRCQELECEKDEFEDKYLQLFKKEKENISGEDHKKAIKNHKQEMKELNEKHLATEYEKQEAITKMEKVQQEMGEIKIKLGELEADNNKLEAGGGRDINLEIIMNLENLQNNFSIFKKDEFEYPQNLSREQLILWCEHFKLLIAEINDELCSEINGLSERNEILENYIESQGFEFDEINKINDEIINDLPHPLPSYTIDNIEQYNPTKKQLKEYVDIIFNEWRRDENDNKKIINNLLNNNKLLNELENSNTIITENENENKNEIIINKLKKQLENEYLKQEEVTLELNKKIDILAESNEQLMKQLRTEQQKNKIIKNETGSFNEIKEEEEEEDNEEEEDDKLLLNRLNDTEHYIKELEDEMKKLEFETTQQKQILEREYKYQMELINIDLEESREQCEDLEKQIGSDDLNLLTSEFRSELWDARNDNNDLKKKHIEEIRQLERDRDELLREINLLRIKTDRMDQNTDEIITKMQIELDKKDKELEHFVQVTENLSHLKQLQIDKNTLENEYNELEITYENDKQKYQNNIQQLNIEKKKLIIRIKTAEQDIKSLKQSAGIDSNIITTTELVMMKEEMDNLRIKRTEAIKSKIQLLQNSSLEIEHMRDEIKLLNKYFIIDKRTYLNNRYSSLSSFGSNIPISNNGNTHQTILNNNNNNNNNGYMDSAWNYTIGMLSSITSVFKPKYKTKYKTHYNNNNNNDDEYDIHTEYSSNHHHNSHTSSISNDFNNINHQKKHSRHLSKRHSNASMYRDNYNSSMYRRNNNNIHSRQLSSLALKAKKRQKMHARKLSKRNNKRHYTNSSYIDNGNNNKHDRTISTQSMRHRNKQPSKQEILLDAEENDNVKDAMSKIFQSFDIAQDNVKKQSMDISGVGSDGFNVFSLDDMINNQSNNNDIINNNNRQTYIINDDDDENDNNNNQYLDNSINNIINDQYFDNVGNIYEFNNDNAQYSDDEHP